MSETEKCESCPNPDEDGCPPGSVRASCNGCPLGPGAPCNEQCAGMDLESMQREATAKRAAIAQLEEELDELCTRMDAHPDEVARREAYYAAHPMQAAIIKTTYEAQLPGILRAALAKGPW